MEWRIWITWWIILCIIYSRLFWKYLKKYRERTDNPSICTYVNEREYRITFKIKTGYYFEFSTPEIKKLLGSIKNKITMVENVQNVSHLEIT